MSAATQPGPQPEIAITFFYDQFAKRKREERLSAVQLAARITKVSQPTKERLPWLKCARFGDRRSDKDSLRHDANVEAITGIEGDYDAKPVNGRLITFEEAVERVRGARIAAIVYTSPSHNEDVQKYRVIAPLSGEHPPEERDRYMARLNGLFDGGFAPESWTLSQSYYFGCVNKNPSHRVEIIDGTFIDLAGDLDATAIGNPKEEKKPNSDGRKYQATKPEHITNKRINGLVESFLDNVRSAPKDAKYFTLRDNSYTFGGYLHIIGWTVEQAVEALVGALPDGVKDWRHARDTARKALTAGMEKPLELEERRNPDATQSSRPQQPPPSEPEAEAEAEAEQQKQPYKGRILTGAAFIARHVPPVWLIDGMVQRNRLYACTSRTGHGKTAVWAFNSCMIHTGRMIGDLQVFRGNVLFLAGENPSDLEARFIGMAKRFNLPVDQLPFVLPGSFPLTEDEAAALKREIKALRVPLTLIVGDTASSFFPGDDENSNVQSGSYARTLRGFCDDCEGNPAVVALSHPIKDATRANLLPRGGGAFLNELDGNLTCWSEARGEFTELHWQGKIRGPDFAPFGYRLREVPTGLIDERDRPEMTIVAEPMSEEAVNDVRKQATANEDAVLLAIRNHPDSSLAKHATVLGWLDPDGRPERWKVQRAIEALEADKLIVRKRKGAPWTLTDKGKEALGEGEE